MNIAFKYGSWAAATISLWNILNYVIIYKTGLSKLSFFINVLLLLSILFQGIKKYKKLKYNNEITFGNAALSGIKISLVAAILLSAITFIYCSIPNKNYRSYIVNETEKVMKEQKMKDIDRTIKELRLSFLPVHQAQSSFIFTLAIGVVFSFIYAMIVRNKVNEPAT